MQHQTGLSLWQPTRKCSRFSSNWEGKRKAQLYQSTSTDDGFDGTAIARNENKNEATILRTFLSVRLGGKKTEHRQKTLQMRRRISSLGLSVERRTSWQRNSSRSSTCWRQWVTIDRSIEWFISVFGGSPRMNRCMSWKFTRSIVNRRKCHRTTVQLQMTIVGSCYFSMIIKIPSKGAGKIYHVNHHFTYEKCLLEGTIVI